MSGYLSVFRNDFGEKQVVNEFDALIRSIGIQYEEKYVSTCLGLTHVIVTGNIDKPPVVLIHAFYTSSASWYQNMKILSDNYRIYAINIIGDPNKSKPFKPIRKLNDFLAWFNDFMDEFHLETADFIGNSVGAFHVANYALNYPKRVKRMILIGPAATFRQIMPFYFNTFPGGMTGWSFLVKHAVKWIENGLPFEPGFQRLFFLSLKYGKSANQVFPKVLSNDELKQIKTPTLLIYGDREVIYNIHSAIERAQNLMKNLKVKIILNANHITATSNAALTNEAILEFLNEKYELYNSVE